MPLLSYVSKNFRDDTLLVIDQANRICEDYADQGYDLTLRQLYYQFVARGLIENRQSEYKRLGSIINDARLAGMLDWDFIVDRTRNLDEPSHWSSPEAIIRGAERSYAIDKWADQDLRIEVWVEKEALAGVVESACRDLDLPFFSCRGYVSQSEMWSAGQRFYDYVTKGQRVLVLHLGDHDPSGIDMTRDIKDRIRLFAGGHLSADKGGMKQGEYEEWVEVRRIALNWNQVEVYTPPPNPTKLTDARARGYVELFGNESWELDALEPPVLVGLIRDHVEAERDDERWNEMVTREEFERVALRSVRERWSDVVEFLEVEDEQ